MTSDDRIDGLHKAIADFRVETATNISDVKRDTVELRTAMTLVAQIQKDHEARIRPVEDFRSTVLGITKFAIWLVGVAGTIVGVLAAIP